MNSIKYFHSLDYLRGIAAILVALFHFSDKADYLSDTNSLKQLFNLGHYGVEIFFIISGLVVPYSMHVGNYQIQHFGTFLKKRLIRIEPAYLSCVLIALLCNYLTTTTPFYKGPAFSIDWVQLLAHIGYLNTFIGKDWLNPVFWTLAIEFQYYLLIALFFPILRTAKWYYIVAVLLLFNSFIHNFDRSYVFHFSPYFTIGILLYKYITDIHTYIHTYIHTKTLWAGALVVTIAFLFYEYGWTELWICTFTILIILSPIKKHPIGQFLGNISYSLYLLHFIVGLRIINLTQRYIESENIRIGMIFVALAISIAISYVYYLLIEKPSKAIASKIKYSTPAEKLIQVKEPLI